MQVLDLTHNRHTDSSLTREDFERVLRVLEDCERARSLPELQQLALMSLSEQFGYRASAFAIGSPPASYAGFESGILYGLPSSVMDEYLERWARIGPLSNDVGRESLASGRPVALDDVAAFIEPYRQPFIESFLRPQGINSFLACWLDTGLAEAGYLLLLTSDQSISSRDRALASALRPHLAHFLRDQMQVESPRHQAIELLSPRLREVARLVGQGLSNREIAEALVISEESARKYVSRCLDALGLKRRTQLALAVAGRE